MCSRYLFVSVFYFMPGGYSMSVPRGFRHTWERSRFLCLGLWVCLSELICFHQSLFFSVGVVLEAVWEVTFRRIIILNDPIGPMGNQILAR